MKIKLALCLTIFVICGLAKGGEFAISPMMIELNMAPGERKTFSFQIFGKKSGYAKISFSDLKQQPSGHMDFFSVNTNEPGISKWVSLDKSLVKIKQNELQTVHGEINLPRRAKGSYMLAIMVEDKKKQKEKGVSLNVRYAIIITINTPSKKGRLKSELSNLSIEEQNGHSFISAWFENKSLREGAFEIVAYLRNKERRLTAKIPLLTKASWQSAQKYSRVFPKGKVKVFGVLPGNVVNGEYTLSTKSRFNGRLLATKRTQLIIDRQTKDSAQENTNATKAHSKTVNVNPNPIFVSISNKGRSFNTLRIENPLDEIITVVFPKKDTVSGVTHKFSPNNFKMKSNSTRQVTLRHHFKENRNIDSYYAEIIRADKSVQKIEIKIAI